jgi:outer membrane biogenesis lipoprotein LolB
MRKAATIALSLAALTLAACSQSQSQNPSLGDSCDKDGALTENTHGDELLCLEGYTGEFRWVKTGN